MSSKVYSGQTQRAKIAPPSKFSPKTWLKLRKYVPYSFALPACTAYFFPVISALAFVGIFLFYIYITSQAPTPAIIRAVKNGSQEPAINIGVDELGFPLMLPLSIIQRHILLLGTTGSGKTVTIRSLAESVMKLGGGFCFIDGKADTMDTYAILYEIVKSADRLEDLYVINFLNPQQSHSFNFLIKGDSDFISEIMTGFMKEAEGDNVYWQEQGKQFMKTLLASHVYKRDHPTVFPEFKISLSGLRSDFALKAMVDLFLDERLPENDERGLPVKKKLRDYLLAIGSLDELTQWARGGRAGPSVGEAMKQHGFYIQQWSAGFELLTGSLAPIFNAEEPDIDIEDIVINSRILVVLLPSLVYSGSTLKGLGRIILSTFKIAFSTAIGNKIEGDFQQIKSDVYKNRPTTPFLIIADEYGSYAVEGYDTVLAQARSLGIGVVISVQEIASLMKGKSGDIDGKRLIGNTNIKIIMKVEDNETMDYITKRADEEFYLMPGASGAPGMMTGLGHQIGNLDGQYQYHKYKRLESRDISSLGVGEAYLIYGDALRKYKTRFIPPSDNIKTMKLMKYISRAESYAKAKVKQMAKHAKESINGFLANVYNMMNNFAIGIREECLYRKYMSLRKEYLLEQLNFEINHVELLAELRQSNKVSLNEFTEMKSIVLKRMNFEKFQDDMFAEMVDNEEFNAFAFKPSEDANEFLKTVLTKLSKEKESPVVLV
ncbi:MAG: hypothetical protein DDT19_00002 [Syntrophomonadaceae bacterium]|nr:hypothetical protein [Bacillota bacterium]